MMGSSIQFLVHTPRGRTAVLEKNVVENVSYDQLVLDLVKVSLLRDVDEKSEILTSHDTTCGIQTAPSYVRQKLQNGIKSTISLNPQDFAVLHEGRVLERRNGDEILKDILLSSIIKNCRCCFSCDNGTTCDRYSMNRKVAYEKEERPSSIYLDLRIRGRGGMVDRQNRVGSKFGGGGVSSAQNAERERKDRLKKLALESIDLAKDPYLMRNHLGTYECKLCLTLHTNEANYLAHTQGKKHQQGLARRAHMEKIREQQQQQQQGTNSLQVAALQKQQQVKPRKVRIGRPAYQVFKSRDADTNQRCLSFELQYPEIEEDLQPRHRFMSAFEQRIETPPDRRFQYLLFAAEPYETVAFKIPNEPIDKGEDRFVTHWDTEDKKFIVTLYFIEQQQDIQN